jgi:hypothetical protein
MRFKKTLCSIIAAAGFALAPKPAAADISSMLAKTSPAAKAPTSVQTKTGIRSTKPPLDLSGKIKRFMLKDKKDIGKESSEYSVNMAWLYSDRWYKGLLSEMSTKDRKLWFVLGTYTTERYDVSESPVDTTDIVGMFMQGPLLDKHTRKDIYLDSQVQYTLYRYTLNPKYKRPFQLEAEIRLGAGIGLRIHADEHSYITREGDKEKQVLPSLPEISVDANLLFSATPIVKIGPASVRYTFEVDTAGNLGHILGVGVRF